MHDLLLILWQFGFCFWASVLASVSKPLELVAVVVHESLPAFMIQVEVGLADSVECWFMRKQVSSLAFLLWSSLVSRGLPHD